MSCWLKLLVPISLKGDHIDARKTVNMDDAGVIRSSYPCYIQYEYEQPLLAAILKLF